MDSTENRAEKEYLLYLLRKKQLKELAVMQLCLYACWFLVALSGGIPQFWMTAALYVLAFMSVMCLIAGVCFALAHIFIPLWKG